MWHAKGSYLASVAPDAGAASVCIHSVAKQSTQCPFKKGTKDVQRVLFHPSQPMLFVAVMLLFDCRAYFQTKTHVKVYNLKAHSLVKTLMTGCKWISSMAIHPSGL